MKRFFKMALLSLGLCFASFVQTNPQKEFPRSWVQELIYCDGLPRLHFHGLTGTRTISEKDAWIMAKNNIDLIAQNFYIEYKDIFVGRLKDRSSHAQLPYQHIMEQGFEVSKALQAGQSYEAFAQDNKNNSFILYNDIIRLEAIRNDDAFSKKIRSYMITTVDAYAARNGYEADPKKFSEIAQARRQRFVDLLKYGTDIAEKEAISEVMMANGVKLVGFVSCEPYPNKNWDSFVGENIVPPSCSYANYIDPKVNSALLGHDDFDLDDKNKVSWLLHPFEKLATTLFGKTAYKPLLFGVNSIYMTAFGTCTMVAGAIAWVAYKFKQKRAEKRR